MRWVCGFSLKSNEEFQGSGETSSAIIKPFLTAMSSTMHTAPSFVLLRSSNAKWLRSPAAHALRPAPMVRGGEAWLASPKPKRTKTESGRHPTPFSLLLSHVHFFSASPKTTMVRSIIVGGRKIPNQAHWEISRESSATLASLVRQRFLELRKRRRIFLLAVARGRVRIQWKSRLVF